MSQPTKSHCQYTWTYNTEKHRERYFFCRQWCKISPANLLKWKKTELSPSSLLSINCCNWFRTTVLRKPMTKQGTVPRIFSSTPIATERDAHATRLSTFYKIPVTGHRVHLHGRPRFTGNMFPRSGRRRRHRCQHGHVLDVFTRTASPFVFSSLLYQSVDREITAPSFLRCVCCDWQSSTCSSRAWRAWTRLCEGAPATSGMWLPVLSIRVYPRVEPWEITGPMEASRESCTISRRRTSSSRLTTKLRWEGCKLGYVSRVPRMNGSTARIRSPCRRLGSRQWFQDCKHHRQCRPVGRFVDIVCLGFFCCEM